MRGYPEAEEGLREKDLFEGVESEEDQHKAALENVRRVRETIQAEGNTVSSINIANLMKEMRDERDDSILGQHHG